MAKTVLTPEQITEIANSPLPYKEIGLLYKIGSKRVCDIKKEAGTNRGQGSNLQLIERKLNPAQKLEIQLSHESNQYLADKYKVSYTYISRIRNADKTVKNKGGRPRVEVIKVIAKPLTQQKLSPIKKSKFEEDNIAHQKAVKAKELYQKMEVDKIKNGAKWIERIDRFGKKSMVLSK